MLGNQFTRLFIFASLISLSEIILLKRKYRTFDTVFYHKIKHLEVHLKYSDFFNSSLSVSSCDETLSYVCEITLSWKQTCCNSKKGLASTLFTGLIYYRWLTLTIVILLLELTKKLSLGVKAVTKGDLSFD